MSIPSICRFICTLTISVLLVFAAMPACAQADTAVADTIVPQHKEHKPEKGGHQLCFGVDFFHPVINHLLGDRYSYEVTADYYYRDDYYMVAEGGWGGATVNYPDLKYTTTNKFLRAGFNKSVLARTKPDDWDIMLIGFRVAMSRINRGDASYTVIDSVWGNSTGSLGTKSFSAVWAEITGGMRVELVKGLCVGWNARGKFLLNGDSFKDLSPIYIAGYGKGDRKSIFDFNMYVSYAIRWKRKGVPPVVTPAEEKKDEE
jgi:hypothetical protein